MASACHAVGSLAQRRPAAAPCRYHEIKEKLKAGEKDKEAYELAFGAIERTREGFLDCLAHAKEHIKKMNKKEESEQNAF